MTHTHTHKGTALRRDLYLTTHNIHKRQATTLPVEFEPAIPASERPQTHALDRAATTIGHISEANIIYCDLYYILRCLIFPLGLVKRMAINLEKLSKCHIAVQTVVAASSVTIHQ